ncbi:MAG: hypothetical protein AAFX79_08420 [Planctomycetota bacterium]
MQMATGRRVDSSAIAAFIDLMHVIAVRSDEDIHKRYPRGFRFCQADIEAVERAIVLTQPLESTLATQSMEGRGPEQQGTAPESEPLDRERKRRPQRIPEDVDEDHRRIAAYLALHRDDATRDGVARALGISKAYVSQSRSW